MEAHIVCVLILLALLPVARASYHSSLYPFRIIVTGFFSPLTRDKTSGFSEVADQKYLRAAFEMAIDEVNSDTDLLVYPSGDKATLVSNAIFNTGNIIKAQSNANEAFDAGVMSYEAVMRAEGYCDYVNAILNPFTLNAIRGGVIQANPSEKSSLSLLSINSNWNEPQYIASGRSSFFSDGLYFNQHINIMPSYTLDSNALVGVLNYYGWKRIAVIYDSNSEGIDLKFQLDLIKGDVTYLFDGEFFEESSSALVDDAKASGATIFVLLLSTEHAAVFLEEGYEKGALGRGTAVLLSSTASAAKLSTLITKDDVSDVLEGVLSLELYPKYGLFNTEKGKQFMTNFKALAPTIDASKRSLYPNNAELYCNMSIDDFDSYKYYYNYTDTSYSFEYCLGIEDFSSLDEAAIPEEALFVYDAVYAIAITADRMIKAGLSFSSSLDIYNYIMDGNNTIALASGNMTTNLANAATNDFALGDRISGNYYKLLGYKSDVGNFSEVGMLVDDNLYLCADKASARQRGVGDSLFDTCSDPSYTTDDGSPPTDMWPSVYKYLPTSMVALILVFSFLLLALSVCLGVFVRVYEKQKAIRTAGPGMLYIIIAGLIICAIKGILNAYEGHEAIYCHLDLWLGHIAYRLVVSTLGQKCWRVDKIVNSESFKRVKVTTTDTISRVGSLLLLALTLLAICEIFGSLDSHSHIFDSFTYNQIVMNQLIVHPVCTSRFGSANTVGISNVGDALYIVLLLIQASTTGLAFYYCYRTRDVPSVVNESKPISKILGITTLLAIVSGVFVFDEGTMKDSDARQVLIAFVFLIPAFSTLYYYFLPKVMQTLADVRREQDELNGAQGLKIKHKKGLGEVGNDIVSEGDMAIIMAKLQDNRAYEDRVRICHEEMEKLQTLSSAWLVVMMTLSDTSTGPRTSSVYTIESVDSAEGAKGGFEMLPGVVDATAANEAGLGAPVS